LAVALTHVNTELYSVYVCIKLCIAIERVSRVFKRKFEWGITAYALMKATRLIVLIALTGLAVLYWVSFVLFAEPKDNEVPKHASNSQKINWGAIPTEGIVAV